MPDIIELLRKRLAAPHENTPNYDHGLMYRAFEEITRLQAIVDKLPVTADGVPIYPGMTVFRTFRGCVYRDGSPVEPSEETVCGICVSNDNEKRNGVWTFECPADTVPFGDLYSTLEAMKAAEKARGEM